MAANARRKFSSRTSKPFLFEIDGTDFRTERRISGAIFVDFIRVLQDVQDKSAQSLDNLAELGTTVREMFESVMEPEEFSRFWKWARSPQGCDFEMLIEVLSEMVAEDSDRPTRRPSPSGAGPRRTGATSTDG